MMQNGKTIIKLMMWIKFWGT